MATYKEIKDMYDKGITLKSGIHLTADDVHEVNHICRARMGIDSYEFVAEQLGDEVDYDFPEIEDVAFYEEIEDRTMNHLTGEDEIDVVLYMVKAYRRTKGET